MPQLILGSPPRGGDYFGRESFIDSLWSILDRDSILLVAPRRFGKTGAMYRVLDEPRHGFRPLYVDVEPIRSASDLMVELIAVLLRDRHFAGLMSKLWEGTKGLSERVSKLDMGGVKVELREKTDIRQRWFSYGERVMGLLADAHPRPLLMIDEFAVMIAEIHARDPEEVQQLLRWFRAARIGPNTRTRFLISSSINLIATLDSLSLVDTINDLYVQKLRPFDLETAADFVRAVAAARGVPLAETSIARILEVVGAPIPYVLQVLLTAVFDRQRTTNGEIGTELIDEAFEEDLLGGPMSVSFRHYRSRIDEYYQGWERRAALASLGILSRSETAVARDTLFQHFLRTSNLDPSPTSLESFAHLMDKLENDFYVERSSDTFAFQSRVLRLWWKTHYGFQEE